MFIPTGILGTTLIVTMSPFFKLWVVVFATDTLVVTVQIKDSNGNIIQEKVYDYDTWYHWSQANTHSTSEVNENGTIWQLEQDSITLFNQFTYFIWKIFFVSLMLPPSSHFFVLATRFKFALKIFQ